MIDAPVALSRLPVGSSARTIAGRPTSARAIATRWRSPPESLVGLNVARCDEADAFERLIGARVALGGGGAGVEQPVGDVLAHRGVLGQEELLEDEADLPGPQSRQLAVVQPRRVDPADPDHALARPLQRADDVQKRRLARPGGPDDRHQLAPPDGEGHPAQGEHRRLLAVDLGDPLQLQDRVAHIDGTTTESPSRRSPSTWTRPPPVSNRPSFTATSSRRSPARTTSTANPPPDLPDERGDRDAQGVVHALGGDVHFNRGLVEPARLGRVVEADERRDGRGGGADVRCPAWATRPKPVDPARRPACCPAA